MIECTSAALTRRSYENNLLRQYRRLERFLSVKTILHCRALISSQFEHLAQDKCIDENQWLCFQVSAFA